MSNGFWIKISVLLLIIIEFLLYIVYSVSFFLFYILKLFLQLILNINMTESPKTRKRNAKELPSQTVVNRGCVSANWQKFLSSNFITDNKKSENTKNIKQQYTGTFRRTRMKVEKDAATINLNSVGVSMPHNKIFSTEDKTQEKQKSRITLTKFIAMDCEMVGVGYDGTDNMIARVSLVNKFGDCIYDKFVKPKEEVTDYRTDVSGVRREDLLNGEDFTTVQKEVSEILKGRILVGHSLRNDFNVLFLSHPKRNIRDTSKYKPFKMITKGNTPSLKRLAKEVLGIDIQLGEHNSVEDARVAMQLYCTVAKKWEMQCSQKRKYSEPTEE